MAKPQEGSPTDSSQNIGPEPNSHDAQEDNETCVEIEKAGDEMHFQWGFRQVVALCKLRQEVVSKLKRKLPALNSRYCKPCDQTSFKVFNDSDLVIIKEVMIENNIQFCVKNGPTLTFNEAPKAIICGVPSKIAIAEIMNDLRRQGLKVANVLRLTERSDGTVLKYPSCVVYFEDSTQKSRARNVKNICGAPIAWEDMGGVSVCPRCQRCGHGRCKGTPRCAGCGGGHLTRKCTKATEEGFEAKCPMCSGGHFSGSLSCPELERLVLMKANRIYRWDGKPQPAPASEGDSSPAEPGTRPEDNQ